MKLSFLHIPKTGGTSVKMWLNKFLTPIDSNHGHPKLSEVQIPDDTVLFCCVRNPFAWHVSWYNYMRQCPNSSGLLIAEDIVKRSTFMDYLMLLDSDVPLRHPSEQWGDYPRWQMVDWLSGSSRIPRILRTEQLNRDLPEFISAIGLQPEGRLPDNANATHHSAWNNYYDSYSADIVLRRHSDDFATFGYSTSI